MLQRFNNSTVTMSFSSHSSVIFLVQKQYNVFIDFFYSTYDDSTTPKGEFPRTFQYHQMAILAFVSLLGFELYLNRLLPYLCVSIFKIWRDVPRRGKHLDVLDL